MSYPALSRAEARSHIEAQKQGLSAEVPAVRTVEEGEEEDWDSLLSDLMAKLSKFVSGDPVKKRSDSRGADFEIKAGPVIHSHLPSHEALADPEFWTWVAVMHGVAIVN